MVEVALALTCLLVKYGKRVWQFSCDQLDRLLLVREERYGRRGWGIRLTGLMMLAAALYARPSSHASFMGKYYAKLAAHPFGFDPDNPVPHRIATSLISYLIGMRGQLVIVTNVLLAAVLVFWVYDHYRRHTPRPGDAFLAAAIIASSFVTLSTLYFGGYNDALSFLMLFALLVFRERRWLFFAAFALALFNRETILFFVPWVVYLSLVDSTRKMRRVVELCVGLGIVIGGYWLFRGWLNQHQPIQYSAAFYAGPLIEDPLYWIRGSFSHLGLGYFSVFKALWIVPLAGALSAWLRGNHRLVMSMALLSACAFAQLFFAYDTSRLAAMTFPVMLLGLQQLFETGDFGFRRWIGPLVVLNLLIPNVAVAGKVVDVMQSLLGYLLAHAMGA